MNEVRVEQVNWRERFSSNRDVVKKTTEVRKSVVCVGNCNEKETRE